jgi:CheY-like chemotaxis protein/nitrogen-specific signal transduction histidine kinase
VNLSATDILSSLFLLALVVILFDYYDYTIRRIMGQMEAAKRDALHMAGVKSRFLSSMSHEIRTPLNGIIGFTAMLLREESDPLKIERLNYIRSSGSVLSRIIGNVLDLSKIDDGKMTVERRCYELRKELEAIAIFAVTAQEKGVRFAINIAPETPSHIIGDSLRLNQVLGNLINNAIKFTPSGGEVALDIAVSQEGDRLGFEVVDTGEGIPEGMRQRIFSPFTQLDESVVRRFGGTGLGLSISQRLVQLMGGELRLASRVGEGSRFFFDLPLEECRDESLLPAATGVSPGAGPGLKILVADDDRINQVLMRDFLERMGHEVTVVSDGQEALSAYAHGHHDLILMDISMPVMDGVEATKELRRSGVTIPIIALTANIFKEDVERYLASGMTHCVSKPVDMAQLEQLIHTFCEVSA